jgi:RNA-directed DNA polymerase
VHRDAIKKAIELEARKRLRRRSDLMRDAKRASRAYTKRSGKPATLKSTIPFNKYNNKHFDPRYCLSHASFLAKGIANSIQAKTYRPTPAFRLAIPKLKGGTREINIFSIPDAAVSNLLAKRLIRRNQKRFSPASYAYRTDHGPLDAILLIRSVARSPRVYLTEIDYSNYFDSINHAYLIRTIADHDFNVSEQERDIVRAFLGYRYLPLSRSASSTPTVNRTGTPQGTTISLFVANVAAHPLDMELERRNGVFVRYADDSLVMTFSYDDANSLYSTFLNFQAQSGVRINSAKSKPVTLFSAMPGEIDTKAEFSFLGYAFRKTSDLEGVSLAIGSSKVRQIKITISKIIYRHLLLYPKKSGFNSNRIGGLGRDWDVVACINALRRYLYAGLTHDQIQRAARGILGDMRPRGLMAYFCLVSDQDQLKSLDGWLVNVMCRAIKEREKVIKSQGSTYTALVESDLLAANWYQHPIPNDVRIPSFFLAWRASNAAWEKYGPKGIHIPHSGYGYAGDDV